MPKQLNKTKLKVSALLLSGVCALCVSPALAQNGKMYLAGYMGLNLAKDQDFSVNTAGISGTANMDSAPSFAGALGLRITKTIRAEAELSYRSADIDSFDTNLGKINTGGEFTNYLGMLNLYYDFPVDWKIKPYLSAGLGVGYFDGEINGLNGASYSESDYGLTWSAGAGLQYRTNDKWSWNAGYRYLDSADLNFGDLDLDYSGHEIRVGVTYDLDWK